MPLYSLLNTYSYTYVSTYTGWQYLRSMSYSSITPNICRMNVSLEANITSQVYTCVFVYTYMYINMYIYMSTACEYFRSWCGKTQNICLIMLKPICLSSISYSSIQFIYLYINIDIYIFIYIHINISIYIYIP
jgi:hypothetical protein